MPSHSFLFYTTVQLQTQTPQQLRAQQQLGHLKSSAHSTVASIMGFLERDAVRRLTASALGVKDFFTTVLPDQSLTLRRDFVTRLILLNVATPMGPPPPCQAPPLYQTLLQQILTHAHSTAPANQMVITLRGTVSLPTVTAKMRRDQYSSARWGLSSMRYLATALTQRILLAADEG